MPTAHVNMNRNSCEHSIQMRIPTGVNASRWELQRGANGTSGHELQWVQRGHVGAGTGTGTNTRCQRAHRGTCGRELERAPTPRAQADFSRELYTAAFAK